MARFTKAEMLAEFKNVVFQYARAASFVMEPEAGYRLLFGKNPKKQDDGLHFMNPEVDPKSFGESFSVDHWQASKTMGEFYDYGIQGICDIQPRNVSGATEWTFAYGLLLDVSKSVLISESLNGEFVNAERCLCAARAFFARLALDGEERVFFEGDYVPEGLMTISEVALLADLDERTVRNATAKNANNRLETSIVQSSVFIPREAAVHWLTNKRGFTPTRIGQTVSAEAVLASVEFASAEQAGDFISANRERFKLSQAELAQTVGSGLGKADIAQLEAGLGRASEDVLVAIGVALGLPGPLFALRMLEVFHKEEMAALRRRISSAKSH